ncbi:ribose 5-phosphate isomerase B [Candidatus Peregrinibacteria bacterium]|nr:ribose 5-phosphate isomerase B [Candidatus Peregrinibacteria bacterium]
MNIYLGADHRGYRLKEALKQYFEKKGEESAYLKKYQLVDLGAFSEESVDYPKFAQEVSKHVIQDSNSFGILLCNSGIGMSIAANRFRGVRAALCTDITMVEFSRRHNDANVLCIASDKTSLEMLETMVDVFLNTPFEGGRHERRVQMMDS